MHLANPPLPRLVFRGLLLLLFPLFVYEFTSTPVLLLLPIAFLITVIVLKRLDWIGYAIVVVAFTRADAWATGLTGIPFGTLVAATILLAFAVTVFYSGLKLTAPNFTFAAFLIFFASAFLIGVFCGDTTHAAVWSRDAFYAVLTFATVYCFTGSIERFRRVLLFVVGCGILLSLVNLLELFAPALIRLSHSEGRAAGLLKNANTSAFVITCSFIALQLSCRWGARWPLWLLVPVQVLHIAGVLATFSRGGMLLMIVAFTGSIVLESRHGRSMRGLVCAVLITALVVFAATQYFLGSSDVSVLYSFQKIATFVQGRVDDNYRLFLAKYYFLKFLEQPLTGYGFHATILPSAANTDMGSFFGVKGPHNTPVAIMTEFGAVAGLSYLLLYAAVFLRLSLVKHFYARRYLYLLWIVLFARNVFAHDAHLSRPTMVLLAILAVAPLVIDRKSKVSPQSKQNTAENNGRSAGPKPPAGNSILKGGTA